MGGYLRKCLTPMFIFCIISSITPASCAATTANTSQKTGEGKLSWTIEYNVSGGFAGIHQQLTLNSSGKLTSADKKLKKYVEQQITNEQLMEIANTLELLNFSINEKNSFRLGGKCADCFQYKLTLSVNNRKASTSFNDISLKDSKYNTLIRLLSALMEQALKNK